ncbi:MAG: hypothetical protein QM796_18780 [Chthoniobacteraceae bacterium]
MSIAFNQIDIFTMVKTQLAALVQQQKGVLSIATNPGEVMELLGEAPGRFRVILNWTGEHTQGDYRSGIVKHTLQVIVSQNRGLAAIKGANLSVTRAGDPPLMTLANQVRDSLRALVLPDQTSKLLHYLHTEPTHHEHHPLDAYTQTYAIFSAIPEPDYTPVPN